MQLTFDAHFDAPIAEVFDHLTSSQLYQRLDERSTVVITEHGSSRTLEVERAFDTSAVPSPVRSMVGEAIQVSESTHWVKEGSGVSATFEVRTVGLPASFIGTIELSERKSFTAFSLSGNVKVNVPLIGAGLEKQVGEVLRLQLEDMVCQAQELLG